MKKKFEKIKIRLFVMVCCLAVIFAGWVLVTRLEGERPRVTTRGLASAIRATQDISVSLSDQKSGIRKARIVLVKGDKETVLLDRKFPAVNFLMGGQIRTDTFHLKVVPKKLGISEGKAMLRIVVRDYSWRNWWNGNKTLMEKEVLIDIRPPRIEVLSQQHNITQGGSGLVVYRLSEPCPVHGVQVGDNFFPGYSARTALNDEEADIHMSLIALSYKQGRGTRMVVSATDQAGNTARAGFYSYIRKRTFKKDTIPLSDRFLSSKMPEFDNELGGAAASPMESFLAINRKLRVANTATLKAVAQKSDDTLYWDKSFLRLPNSARRANFADHREYRYEGQIIDRQVHMGIDLASVSRAPVPAANSGRVAFAGDVGIYGGTVMIDHGFGLFSTYSHLSHFDVQEGQMVRRGEVIGQTGATGLAAGDHLHFGMMVHNTFVNPVEWWDPAWVKNNILSKIRAAKKSSS